MSEYEDLSQPIPFDIVDSFTTDSAGNGYGEQSPMTDAPTQGERVMSELLPCPFTGAPARVTLNCRHQWGVVLGKLSFGPFQTKEEAIKAWNTRVEPGEE